MSMVMINSIIESLLKGHGYSTLKECSKDTSGEKDFFLVEDESLDVFNFDDIIEKEISCGCDVPCSVDSLLYKDGILHIIEFKNTIVSGRSKKRDIKLKIYETILFFVKEFSLTTNDMNNIKFILVCLNEEIPTHRGVSRADLSVRIPKWLKFIHEYTGIEPMVHSPKMFLEYLNLRN
ncbi:hypothetical protein UE46_07465 [Listeria weihenstephanensis]|uniref:Uncharacterized protein n=2 Tax=Listeria weihenstephanensis TaxID=1006155 RepID=A0A1S7FU13_9LIST|nr:hypothetical protein UE46_07465 [Listeria weihenstephanensis]